jgi:ubiquinone/menaquinone biosynthesis C-methylase UbiE
MNTRTQTWKEFWDALAISCDPIAATDRPTVAPSTYQLYSSEIMQKLDLGQHDVLLDVGCGTGVIDAHLAPHVHKIFATDFSLAMTQRARSGTARYGNVYVVNCDCTALPFRDGVFPKLVMYAVAQYLSSEQIDQGLREAHRVTQPGGLTMLGEIPRARDASCLARIRDVWMHEGLGGILRKVVILLSFGCGSPDA